MVAENKNIQLQTQATGVVVDTVSMDFKTSIVIVSLLANLALFVTWLTTIA